MSTIASFHFAVEREQEPRFTLSHFKHRSMNYFQVGGVRPIYITNVRMPAEKAHGIQIAKMCEAFSDCGVDLELIVPRRRNVIKEDPYDFYGIKRKMTCYEQLI